MIQVALRLHTFYDFFIYPGFFGPGVIWSALIPAKAGIYSASLWKRAFVGLDSRFRGNDRRLE